MYFSVASEEGRGVLGGWGECVGNWVGDGGGGGSGGGGFPEIK